MKINPIKCIFGVESAKFLGHIVSRKGIEVDPIKVQAILEMSSPATIKDVQKLNGQLTALGRFISRSSDKCKHFFDILKKGVKFACTQECEEALKKIKENLIKLSILQKPEPGEELLICLTVTPNDLSTILLRTDEGVEKPIFYVSKTFNPAERNYPKIEVDIGIVHQFQEKPSWLMMILSWQRSSFKCRACVSHDAPFATALGPCILNSLLPIPNVPNNEDEDSDLTITSTGSRFAVMDINNWMTSTNSHIVVEFLAEFPSEEDEGIEEMIDVDESRPDPKDLLQECNHRRWEIFVDGSSNSFEGGMVIVFTSPAGVRIVFCFRLEYKVTNNEAEYEAVIQDLRIAIEMGLDDVRITSDSQLVIRQIEGRYNAVDPDPKVGYIRIERLMQPPVSREEKELRVMIIEEGDVEVDDIDWRAHVYNYLTRGDLPRDRQEANKIKSKATNYEQFEGENVRMLFNAFKIQFGKLTPLYPQNNGQAEATNKTLASTLKKKLEGHHKGWCEQIPNILWSYRTIRRDATGMSPFCLTYGMETVLPAEAILLTTRREAWEKGLNSDLILAKLDDLEENRVRYSI
ncbi:uncharacterized protein LOC113318970 [Papaver somniferum]|uniref:uncharacterized protein LOC113318970 n=1 Tax=Papaver somniferum TaxID=3469 RepID=UPI000E703DFC|nr:uncharacterized protein LOC113318970 [Papaver somniferum]